MRTWMIVVALLAAAFPASAARRVTITELQQFLTAQYAAHKSDAFIAGHLGEMELSEQLTGPTLDRITANLKPGKKAAQALQLLADKSAFLEPPAGEIPNKAAPDIPEQVRLFRGAVDFASVTLEKLPDFLATRTTYSFDDAVIHVITTEYNKTDVVGGGVLNETGEFRRQIAFRAGAEVNVDVAAGQSKVENPGGTPLGLTTFGEFGPLLGIIMADSAKGQVSWSHWEETRAGLAAVFKFSVPQEASHYTVDFCCVFSVPFLDSSDAKQNGVDSDMPTPFHATLGYHGFIYLDSETGAVLRMTVEADLHGDEPMSRLGAWVEYGPVEIGEKSYLCPVRSTAFTVLHAGPRGEPGLTRLNEVTFTNYHRFGSTARILPATPQP